MKKIFILTFSALFLSSVQAAIPGGYYNSLSGKKGTALKHAAKSLAEGHEVVKYGEDTWTAFAVTDVVDIDSRKAWRDMYSNELVWVSTGHGSLNIEHSVPKSWWGGAVNDAYQDLFHLNPSNPNANNRKSNWPMGRLEAVTWTNGITSLGTPVSTDGGGARTVFEPAAEFRGDFARAYFYIFTTYDNLEWDKETAWMYSVDASGRADFQKWAVDMLLSWAREDPVDSYELARNENVYGIQGNRNPFIDIPDLAEYLWGELSGKTFYADGIKDPEPVDRPETPVFVNSELTAFNTYSGRWWDAFTLKLQTDPKAVTQYCVNGEDWDIYEGGIDIAAAMVQGAQLTVRARSFYTIDGLTLISPVASLLLTAKNPEITDYKDSAWRLVKDDSEIDAESLYILVSAKTFNIMSTKGEASSSNKYVLSAGTVNVEDGWVSSIPEGTALLSFPEAGSVNSAGSYMADERAVAVKNLSGEAIGYLLSNSARQMVVSPSQFTPVTISVADDGASILFGEKGRLQFNVSSPRFVPYTSNQEPVCLYINDPDNYPGFNGISTSEAEDMPERIFDLQGRELTGRTLSPGLYIIVRGTKATKIIF